MASKNKSVSELVEDLAARLPSALAPATPWQEKLVLYLERLFAYNRAFNLVGPNDMAGILDLVADSFQLAALLKALPIHENPIALDCGAGAGLPGIPLRMIWQQGRYTLIEARRKRAIFLANVLAELDLPNTFVHHGDAFALKKKADLVISRAWLPMPRALDYCAARLAPGGFAIFFAGDAPLPDHPDFTPFMDATYESGRGTKKILAARYAHGI